MAEETDPRATAYFNCLASAIKAEERRERTVAMPETAAPPAVRCSEWVAELEAAATELNDAVVARLSEDIEPKNVMRLMEAQRRLDRVFATKPRRSATEKLSDCD